MRALLLSVLILPGACATLPDPGGRLSAAANESAAPPELVPLAPLLAAADGITITPEVSLTVQNRAAALRTRAARLRGPVVDPATRQRMARGVRGP